MERRRKIMDPAMSDRTLLLSVEDLIDRALGPVNCNVVHYKLVQTILHIIARQMRLLEQLVEIKMDDLEEEEEGRRDGEKERSPRAGKKGRSKKTPKDKGSPDKYTEKDKDEKSAKDEKAAKDEKDKASKDEKDKAAKDEKDKAKKDKAAEKAAAKAAKDAEKERDKSKEKSKKVPSATSIAISEVERQKEKVLVVEKAPSATRSDRRASIDVVTRSEFDLVASMVEELQRRSGPPPPPAMPSNKKLRSDIAKGNASLTDTMEAMQLAARVKAAEQAIAQMGDLLTQLAASGALPRDVKQQVEAVASKSKHKMSVVGHKSVAIDPMTREDEDKDERDDKVGASRYSIVASRASIASPMSLPGMPGVTHPEMEVALDTLKEDLLKHVQVMTAKANSIANNAFNTANSISDKINIAIQLSSRISSLNSLVLDYADQLSGLDTGLTTQMVSFRDQMNQMRAELQAGLAQIAVVNNNAETVAVVELTERYELLVSELERTLHAHNALNTLQHQLSDEMRTLVECVEMLREQKADRDEVLDGLRDKADLSRLAGLLTAEEFAEARAALEARLAVCHDKFNRQENVWMSALKDLLNMAEDKADLTQLLATRDNAEKKLQELQEMQAQLAIILGEPKAALIMRALSRGAYCASCLVPALMEPADASYGQPPPLPPLRAPPCVPVQPEWQPPELPDHRTHICNRWVGGSHTLLSAAVTRERAPPPPAARAAPTKQYLGYGDDGRLYMMEEEMQPCLECNLILAAEQGAGDQEVSKPDDEKK